MLLKTLPFYLTSHCELHLEQRYTIAWRNQILFSNEKDFAMEGRYVKNFLPKFKERAIITLESINFNHFLSTFFLK